MKYCADIFSYHRRKTREVMVGDVGVGGDNPIRIQSMTISDTMDTEATVREVLDLVAAGCEIVRITAPSIKEAENLKNIKDALLRKGCRVPLVADIHFTPNAAMVAADYVEKVRINPGNYADKKKFAVHEYSDAEYELELARIEEKFKPLVLKCKRLHRAMRIGTNHGSLSDRIMNRFGDTPEGMVESALEFVRICRKYDFHDIVLSMKSSNPQVAIQAYRLLAVRMTELGMDYPFHLGVTEAGDGMEGRVKSAVGIGSLLLDGIGDTVRVSLTEDAVNEVPVARKLVEPFNRLHAQKTESETRIAVETNGTLQTFHPVEYQRRKTLASDHVFHRLGDGNLPRMELPLRSNLSDRQGVLNEMSRLAGESTNALTVVSPGNTSPAFRCETVHIKLHREKELDGLRSVLNDLQARQIALPVALDVTDFRADLFDVARQADRLVLHVSEKTPQVAVYEVLHAAALFAKPVEFCLHSLHSGIFQKLFTEAEKRDYWNLLFSLGQTSASIVYAYRYLAAKLDALQAPFPIVLRYASAEDDERFLLHAAAQLGALFCDGIGDAVYLASSLPVERALDLGYTLLQATRLRISKTDYISCPSCGRTLFNLQTTTERIKAKTDHLKGVKIAIMGCIVNGPGEMADADFGYVGAGPGKVNLFVGKECVERNIPESEADGRLIDLIKKHGMWVER